MTCNKNCDCPKHSRKDVVVAVLFMVVILSMSFGMWKLFNLGKGSPCAVEVQFSGGSKATYIGTSV